ncbi:kinase-like domain-containing protein [Rhizophagus clarus]|uniref:Kinase-like domain-containing protein n=1 Tax=Rhizophagus clarus TaxID=94130 RepID=A0A8H3L4L5_9GLOM|nr:kinase-like domain-containing protein [Rhizophagus clarus]
MPYIAPEVSDGEDYTSASDILNKGERPAIKTKIPSRYKELMERYWDADPLKRPRARVIFEEITKMRDDSYDDKSEFNALEYSNSSDDLNSIPDLNSNSGSD